MANVVQGGLVGQTGAQQTQQNIQAFSQSMQQRNALAETARQFNVGTEFDLLTKLAQGNSLGILGVAQSDQGAGLFGSMFDKMGISQSTRNSFFETTASLPPTAKAAYETMVSLMLRDTGSVGGERATEENLTNIAAEFQGAEKLPVGQRDAEQVAGVPGPTSPDLTGQGITLDESTITPGTEAIDITKVVLNNIGNQLPLTETSAMSPEDTKLFLESIGRNEGFKTGSELDAFVAQATPVFNDNFKAIVDFHRGDSEVRPNLVLGGSEAIETGNTVKDILNDFGPQGRLTLGNLSGFNNEQSREANVTETLKVINSVLPKSAETDGLPDRNLSGEQVKALRNQMLDNVEKGKDINFIPEPEDRENLWWWREGATFAEQEGSGQAVQPPSDRGDVAGRDVRGKGPKPFDPQSPQAQRAQLAGELGSGVPGDFVPRIKQGVSVGAVEKVNANFEQASTDFQSNPTDPEVVKDMVTANNGLIRVSDFLAAEKDPEVRAGILQRFDQVMNDPQALEGLAGAIPDNAQTFLTLAAQRRYEKLAEEGNLPVDPKVQLELEKLAADTGLTRAKALEMMVNLSTKTGLDFAQIGPDALGKAVLFQTRGEGVFSPEQIANLNTANEGMAKIIEDRGNSAVDDEDFKNLQKLFNTTMSAGLNTPNVDYTTAKPGGNFLGNLWRGIFGGPVFVTEEGTGQAQQEIQLSDNANSLADDFINN